MPAGRLALLLLACSLAAAAATACDGGGADAPHASGVPGAVFQALDDHVRNTGLDGAAVGLALVADCSEIGAAPALCVDASASTVLEGEATVRLYANQSDASWDVSLLKRNDGWLVTNVAYTGLR